MSANSLGFDDPKYFKTIVKKTCITESKICMFLPLMVIQLTDWHAEWVTEWFIDGLTN